MSQINKKWIVAFFGLLIFISTFLPWATADLGFGMKASEAGTGHSGGILAMIMGLVAIGINFINLPQNIQRLRGIVYLGAGVIAIIGVITYWSALSGTLGSLFMEAVSPGFGMFMCIVCAVVVALFGIIELRSTRTTASVTQEKEPEKLE